MKKDKQKPIVEKILDRRMTCPKCRALVYFSKDDVLDEEDWSDATDTKVWSLRCPHCGERNIIASRDKDGNTKTYIKVEEV